MNRVIALVTLLSAAAHADPIKNIVIVHGAFADASLWQHIRDAGADPEAALSRHLSYDVLHAADALFDRGPTGTNVMDLVLAVVG